MIQFDPDKGKNSSTVIQSNKDITKLGNHKYIQYDCDQCDHVATKKILKRHKEFTHQGGKAN